MIQRHYSTLSRERGGYSLSLERVSIGYEFSSLLQYVAAVM